MPAFSLQRQVCQAARRASRPWLRLIPLAWARCRRFGCVASDVVMCCMERTHDSGWLRMTPDDSDSGRLRATPDDSERLRILKCGPTFRSRFPYYWNRIGVDSGFLPILPITSPTVYRCQPSSVLFPIIALSRVWSMLMSSCGAQKSR